MMNSKKLDNQGFEMAWERFNHCIKNAGHQNFVPIEKFSHKHLPDDHTLSSEEKDALYNVIKLQAELTVRLQVGLVSSSRSPEDPFHGLRGKHASRSASGWIMRVDEMAGSEVCSCSSCREEVEGGRKEWFVVLIRTASHVVWDQAEAEVAKVDCFYDDHNFRGEEKDMKDNSPYASEKVPSINRRRAKLECVALIDSDPDLDTTTLKCVTHDRLIYLRLRSALRRVASKKTLLMRSSRPASPVCVSSLICKSPGTLTLDAQQRPTVIIVSHPHGMPKMVTVGDIAGVRYTSPSHDNNPCVVASILEDIFDSDPKLSGCQQSSLDRLISYRDTAAEGRKRFCRTESAPGEKFARMEEKKDCQTQGCSRSNVEDGCVMLKLLANVQADSSGICTSQWMKEIEGCSVCSNSKHEMGDERRTWLTQLIIKLKQKCMLESFTDSEEREECGRNLSECCLDSDRKMSKRLRNLTLSNADHNTPCNVRSNDKDVKKQENKEVYNIKLKTCISETRTNDTEKRNAGRVRVLKRPEKEMSGEQEIPSYSAAFESSNSQSQTKIKRTSSPKESSAVSEADSERQKLTSIGDVFDLDEQKSASETPQIKQEVRKIPQIKQEIREMIKTWDDDSLHKKIVTRKFMHDIQRNNTIHKDLQSKTTVKKNKDFSIFCEGNKTKTSNGGHCRSGTLRRHTSAPTCLPSKLLTLDGDHDSKPQGKWQYLHTASTCPGSSGASVLIHPYASDVLGKGGDGASSSMRQRSFSDDMFHTHGSWSRAGLAASVVGAELRRIADNFLSSLNSHSRKRRPASSGSDYFYNGLPSTDTVPSSVRDTRSRKGSSATSSSKYAKPWHLSKRGLRSLCCEDNMMLQTKFRAESEMESIQINVVYPSGQTKLSDIYISSRKVKEEKERLLDMIGMDYGPPDHYHMVLISNAGLHGQISMEDDALIFTYMDHMANDALIKFVKNPQATQATVGPMGIQLK